MRSLEEIADETFEEIKAHKDSTRFEFKVRKQPIPTSEFWYDLTSGGYLKPEKLLNNPDQITKVREAIQTIISYAEQAEEQIIIENI